MSQTRQASLRALAKINLDLRVLHARPDGYHEIRTIFQTISLADIIDVEFTPARRTAIESTSAVEIPDNLIAKAANLALDAMRHNRPGRFPAAQTNPHGRGFGGRIVATPPQSCWRCPPWPTPSGIAAAHGTGRRTGQRRAVLSCWAEPPSPWAAAPNCIRCPICPRAAGF